MAFHSYKDSPENDAMFKAMYNPGDEDMASDDTHKRVVTKDFVAATLRDVSMPFYSFRVGEIGDGAFLQVVFLADGEEQRGRKWYVSPHAGDNEIVQTALMAILAADEHEVRERFKWKGRAIFAPHYALHALHDIAEHQSYRS